MKNTYHVWSEAGFILPLQKLTPVDVGKEVVRLDLRSTVGTQSAHRVTVQQSTEKIPRSRRDDVAAGEGQRLLQDLTIHFVGVFIIEWRQACQHLVEQNTESPPIHSLGVAVAKEKFWSQIFRGSTER